VANYYGFFYIEKQTHRALVSNILCIFTLIEMVRLSVILISLLFQTHVLFAQTNNEQNMSDPSGKKQGYWKRIRQNGKPVYEGNFKDDKPFGAFKYYYESGTIKAISNFSVDGTCTFTQLFNEEGKKMAEGKYVNEKKDSLWKYFGEGQLLLSEEYYSAGIKNGISKIYYQDGSVAEEKTWKNGVEEGAWKQFYPTGELKSTGNYLSGSLEGEVLFYYPDQKLSARGLYSHSLKDGTWKYFDSNGKVLQTEEYKQGVLKGGIPLLITPKEQEELKKKFEGEDSILEKY
jgi:antitoxin component YwqK of YwqJK toxin-antitoxin module